MAREAGDTVRNFVAAWARCDVDELLGFFTDDAVWHPMPTEPAVGKDQLRAAFSAWMGTAPDARILRQVADGNVVMHERVDRGAFDGQEFEVPVAAVFEIADDGRIRAWREYFDMSPFNEPS